MDIDAYMSDIDQHQKFMRIAIMLVEQNVQKALGGPFGAVIVKDGKVIAKSRNKVTLKKTQQLMQRFLQSELPAKKT